MTEDSELFHTDTIFKKEKKKENQSRNVFETALM